MKKFVNIQQMMNEYELGTSLSILANKNNCSPHTIKRVLIEQKIPIRGRKEATIAYIKTLPKKLDGFESEIISKYQNEMSILAISKAYKVSTIIVKGVLNKYNVKLRTPSETSQIQHFNGTTISQSTMNKVNGWLLGDGSLEGSCQACFKMVSKHKKYIEYIESIFQTENLKYNK